MHEYDTDILKEMLFVIDKQTHGQANKQTDFGVT